MRRPVGALAAAFAVAALVPACSGGQAVLPNQSNVPVSQQAIGVPGWIQVGTRLTWYAAAASVAQSRFQWIEDPNGNYLDPTTGKRYRRSDEAGPQGQAPEDPPAASGDGLSQIDVLAIEGDNVVLSSNLFTFDRINNLLLHTPVGGGSVPGTSVDGAWIHPQTLAQLAGGGAGVTVLRGPYTLGGTAYDSLSLTSGLGGGGNSYSYTYDLQTGVLLSANTTTAGGITTPLRAPGDPAPPISNTQLTMARFAGFRQRSQPGIDAQNPDWVAGTSQLSYQGTYNWVNPIDPTSGNLTYPMEHTVSIQPGGANWASFRARSVVPGLIDSQLEGVVGPSGGYWYSPQALASMSVGQVLDQDGLTGDQVTVTFVGVDRTGNDVVVVESLLPGVSTTSSYSRADGVLLAYQQEAVQTTGITITLQLFDRR